MKNARKKNGSVTVLILVLFTYSVCIKSEWVGLEVDCTITNTGSTAFKDTPLARLYLVDKDGAIHKCQRVEDEEDQFISPITVAPGESETFRQDGSGKIGAGISQLYAVLDGDSQLKSAQVPREVTRK